MDFSIPPEMACKLERFDDFVQAHIAPNLKRWTREKRIPRDLYRRLAEQGWLGLHWQQDMLQQHSRLRETLLLERLAETSPGVAVTLLIVSDLGLTGLALYGTEALKHHYGAAAAAGEILICIGNSENMAGSDAAGVAAAAEAVKGGYRLTGAKAYVTHGAVADLAIITAATDPKAPKNRRLSMFLVDLNADGVSRYRLDKSGWAPADLTRIQLDGVFVAADHLLGEAGRGLAQVLNLFTHSRVPISGIALGTARGALNLALKHGRRRKIFDRAVLDFQAKSFEAAELYARLEAARLVVLRAASGSERDADYRLKASLSKFLAVDIARAVSSWAADMFGAVSVMDDHPIHKFPLDAWAVSLAEGTQDVQKLVIFREMARAWAIKGGIP